LRSRVCSCIFTRERKQHNEEDDLADHALGFGSFLEKL
jgi:hypothetical protein